MKRIYDWDAKFSLRNYTAADLQALKGVRKLTQTTANSEEEAAAASDAGIDLVMGNAVNAKAVRRGAPNLFYTAAIPMPYKPAVSKETKMARQMRTKGIAVDSIPIASPVMMLVAGPVWLESAIFRMGPAAV